MDRDFPIGAAVINTLNRSAGAGIVTGHTDWQVLYERGGRTYRAVPQVLERQP